VGFGAGQLYPTPLKDGVVRRLVGEELTIEYADGRSTTRAVPADDLPEVLAALDVVLSDEEVDRLKLV
jgi:N-hydroxyarylamine O-acetyltransferase